MSSPSILSMKKRRFVLSEGGSKKDKGPELEKLIQDLIFVEKKRGMVTLYEIKQLLPNVTLTEERLEKLYEYIVGILVLKLLTKKHQMI